MSRGLIEHFDIVAGSEGGVGKLRELILCLAVRGKLVPQNSGDEPARVLLQRVRAERERLTESGRVRAERPPNDSGGAEIVSELPKGWELVRLAEIAWPQAGFAFKSRFFNDLGHGMPLVRIRDVGSNHPTTFFSETYREEFVVSAGDWLISMDGDFRVAQWKGPRSLLNQRVTRLVFFGDEVSRELVSTALQLKLSEIQGQKAYTTVDHLSGGQIANCTISLPPLTEQRRIEAGLRELTVLCDRLESEQSHATRVHEHWVDAALDQLAESADAEEFSCNWQHLATHWDQLFITPESVDGLEATLMKLAVRGKLLPQVSTDEPASELLEKIRAQKRWLVKAGKLKREGNASPDSSAGNDTEPLPADWVESRLCDLTLLITDGTHRTPRYVEEGVRFVSAKDIRSGRLSFESCRYITREEHDELSRRCNPERGDILISKSGSIGTVVRVEDDGEFSLFESLALIKFPQDLLVGEFLQIALRVACSGLDHDQVKGVAVKHLHLNVIREMRVPLPPLQEQRRIVARLRHLTDLLAKLRTQIQRANAKQVQLAEKVIGNESGVSPGAVAASARPS